MPTTNLAAGTTGADSSDITVVAGTPKTIGVFRDDEKPISSECECQVYRKDANGDYTPTGLWIGAKQPNVVLHGPGVFMVRRPDSLTYPHGISED